MPTAVTVLSVVLALAFLTAGVMKLAGARFMRRGAEHLGYSYSTFRMIGVLEVAAATGVVVGIWWRPLTAAAAAGLFALMIAAVVVHRRANDRAGEIALPASLGMLASVTAALATITM